MRRRTTRNETTRVTITWSKQADRALRLYLNAQGMKKRDISKFIEEAVCSRIFHQTVRQVRKALAEVTPDELQRTVKEAVEKVRTKRHQERLPTDLNRRFFSLHLWFVCD